MRIAGLVQARMGSSRLPGKVMLSIRGRPMIGHLMDRIERVAGLAGIVVATTVDPRNDALADYARSRGVEVHRERGEDDIASRLLGAARLMRADAVLKVNGDCPLVDPAVLQQLVDAFRAAGEADYASNKVEWTFPEGLSAEVIATRALDWCAENLADPVDRELVANYIRDHRDRFKVVSVTSPRNLSRHRWVVDTPEDFVFITRIFDVLSSRGSVFGLDDILKAIESAPDLQHEPAQPVH
jgi:spore coat polysaccharide biosynthesis protein SpsF (cytidylyltransferase family)